MYLKGQKRTSPCAIDIPNLGQSSYAPWDVTAARFGDQNQS